MNPLGAGKCSWFGGVNDGGVGQLEGLSLVDPSDLAEWWFGRCFLQGENRIKNEGLARNLDPSAFYLAMRFAYSSFSGIRGEILSGYSRDQIRRGLFKITFKERSIYAQATDWGPNLDTGRFVDLSPGALAVLGANTDDVVNVFFID